MISRISGYRDNKNIIHLGWKTKCFVTGNLCVLYVCVWALLGFKIYGVIFTTESNLDKMHSFKSAHFKIKSYGPPSIRSSTTVSYYILHESCKLLAKNLHPPINSDQLLYPVERAKKHSRAWLFAAAGWLKLIIVDLFFIALTGT